MVFYADSYSSTTSTYSTDDGTCGGAQTSASTEIWRFRLGGELPARVGAAGTEVMARAITLQNSFETVFTIVYVDEEPTPRRLYFGDLSADPLQDGTAPARRPAVLATAAALTSG
jgi:hypothetical protein